MVDLLRRLLADPSFAHRWIGDWVLCVRNFEACQRASFNKMDERYYAHETRS